MVRLGQTIQISAMKTDGMGSRHYCFRLMLRKRRLGGGRCLANEFEVDPSLEQWAGFKLEMSGPGVRSGE